VGSDLVRTSSRILAVVVFGLCGTAAGTPAYAHNALTSSDPSDGAALEQGPGEVRLTFLATIDPDHADLSVTGPDFRSAWRRSVRAACWWPAGGGPAVV
jgi:hypothetical protein